MSSLRREIAFVNDIPLSMYEILHGVGMLKKPYPFLKKIADPDTYFNKRQNHEVLAHL